MVAILAFDSKAVQSMLSEDFVDYFKSEYPIIYKNKNTHYVQKQKKKIPVYTYYNAIDVAMQNNQIRAVSIIIDHVIKYQDNFVSAYLFRKNLI